MKLNKKAMEMSLSTVVVAIILLVVLGVIIFIFSGGMSRGSGAINNYFDRIGEAGGDEESPNDPSKILGEGWDDKPRTEWFLPLIPLSGFLRKKRV